MREILFRGKRTDNDEWVVSDSIIHFEHILDRSNCYQLWERENGWVNVDAETLGQFTGLTDKNGKRIFEGDIVKYENALFTVEYYAPHMAYYMHGLFGRGSVNGFTKTSFIIEVIGNIHDNPELLKGGE